VGSMFAQAREKDGERSEPRLKKAVNEVPGERRFAREVTATEAATRNARCRRGTHGVRGASRWPR